MSDFDTTGKQAGESARRGPAWEERNTTPANLVLEGGAMRGQFTAGVLDCFVEHGLFCDRVVGVSAGALYG